MRPNRPPPRSPVSSNGSPLAPAGAPAPVLAGRPTKTASPPFAQTLADVLGERPVGAEAPTRPLSRPRAPAPPAISGPAESDPLERRLGPGARETERRPKRADRSEDEIEDLALDPALRSLAQLAPPAAPAAAPPAPAAPTATPAPLDPSAMAAVVEAAAFWGDGARGLARLRFGHRARGGLAGATVTLTRAQDDGSLALRVEGAEDDEAIARLRARLATAGIALDGSDA